MPQKTIWLPEELDVSLKKLGDQVNVSAISQEALKREVQRLQPLEVDGGDISAIVERLRAERVEYQEGWRRSGQQLAAEWVKQAKYPRLLEAAKATAGEKAASFDPISFVLDLDFPGHYEEWEHAVGWAERTFPAFKELTYSGRYGEVGVRECDDRSFAEGWIDGFNAFWSKIKDLL